MLHLTHSGYDYSEKRCVDVTEWFVDEYLSRYNIDINISKMASYSRSHNTGTNDSNFINIYSIHYKTRIQKLLYEIYNFIKYNFQHLSINIF